MDIDRRLGDLSGGVWWGHHSQSEPFCQCNTLLFLLDVAAGGSEMK